jgi:RNA polymerase sigma factor (sigma-70 family)
MDLNDTLADRLQQQLDALAAGDTRARDRIFELCSDRLRFLAERMLRRFPNVGRWEQADDICQEANIKLLHALDQITFHSPRDLMAISATNIKWVLLDLARRYGGPMSDAANHASVGGGDFDPLAAAAAQASPLEQWTALHQAIDELREPWREVFHLVWYMGADQQTVAKFLNVSTRTVKRYWREAREQVRAALGNEPPEHTRAP